ncbi:MAG TPA: sigma-70 family RNA polymerase sigma factor [Candidatus Limnocylindrales bacterium]|nr:sigma-70 family RNA polymerase sigma factor [Candidatus Limnocylindrales bacterium]
MNGVAPTTAIGRSDVELAADGDEVAFGRLVAQHYDDMARVAFVITGDRSLAQDAVQSAWVRAWTRLRTVRDPERVRAWLLTIAANEARQTARRNRRATVVELDVDVEGTPRMDPAIGIDRIDLARALAGLSPDDRALLALRYVAGVDAPELGLMTGRTASGTRAHLSRLTARLRKELGDD